MNIERILNFRTIIILIFVALLSYGIYWLVISNIFKDNLLLQLAENKSISYKTINSSGFPTQIQTNINKFEGNKYKVYLDELVDHLIIRDK